MISLIRRLQGFTLIEIVIFIVVTGILASTIMLAGNTGLLSAPSTANQINANLLAQQCMEWLIGKRHLQGYPIFGVCPGGPYTPLDNVTNAFCATQGGYTLTPTMTCGTDTGPTYYTLTVSVTGQGNANLTAIMSYY